VSKPTIVRNGERPSAVEGETAPCPLCGHEADARMIDLYCEALYIDRASDLAKFLQAQGLANNGRGLVVRRPTFTTAVQAAPPPARRRRYIPAREGDK